MSAEYTAKNLGEIADFFDTLASDQLGCVRFQRTQKAKRECEIKARVWNDAAELLRGTTMTGDA